jgi:hypothetical protein
MSRRSASSRALVADAARLDAAGLTPAGDGGAPKGCVLWLSPKALVPLLDYRRRLGAAPLAAPAPADPRGGAARPRDRERRR